MEKNAKKIIKPSFLLQIALFAILFIFLLLPLIYMVFQIKSDDINYIFTDSNFYTSLLNSLLYSFISAFLAIILATISAYLLSRLKIKRKKWLILLLTMPMLIPTVSIGLGVKILFGTSGYFNQLFGTNVDGTGFFNLIFCSSIYAFPVAFLLIYDAFLYEDRSVYDASNTLGISRLRTFFGITLPYAKTAIISAFFASFTLIFADYGLPMEVAGKVKTLPMYLYENVLSMFRYGRGATISLILLVPALIAFVFDVVNKDNDDGLAREESIAPTKTFNIISYVIISLIAILLIIPQFCFVSISFIEKFPSNMNVTFKNYVDAFSPYSSVSISRFLFNSLFISLLTGIFGTIIAYLCGYITTRTNGKLSKPLHFISIATLAVPGLVLGVGYVFLFDFSYGWFMGTYSILIVVNIIHYFSSPYLMAKNAFSKINRDYETIAETLGISRVSLFFKVIVPNTCGTIMQMFSYLLIR